mmetsp:Transcript_11603/g.38172  ORF Transcript_11603/g.38172 Transcript_11603/m.38172 type:complete len:245 (-) Transcript_11603:819-1553(-)
MALKAESVSSSLTDGRWKAKRWSASSSSSSAESSANDEDASLSSSLSGSVGLGSCGFCVPLRLFAPSSIPLSLSSSSSSLSATTPALGSIRTPALSRLSSSASASRSARSCSSCARRSSTSSTSAAAALARSTPRKLRPISPAEKCAIDSCGTGCGGGGAPLLLEPSPSSPFDDDGRVCSDSTPNENTGAPMGFSGDHSPVGSIPEIAAEEEGSPSAHVTCFGCFAAVFWTASTAAGAEEARGT